MTTVIKITVILGLFVAGCGVEYPPGDDGVRIPEYQSQLAIFPRPLDFGPTSTACEGQRPIELRNRGQRAITIDRILWQGARNFDANIPTPLTLIPGEARRFEIFFGPSSVKPFRGALRIETETREVTDVRLLGEGVMVPSAALDVAVALDVSSSMLMMPSIYGALVGLFDWMNTEQADVSVGLVTFVNDVRVHEGGASLSKEQFFAELNIELSGALVPSGSSPRNVTNHEPQDNVLDALSAASAEFQWREGVDRAVLLLSDSAFFEPPNYYSGGIPAMNSVGEVAQTFVENGITLHAVMPLQGGEAQGIIAPNSGSSPSIVTLTGGEGYDLSELGSDSARYLAVFQSMVASRCD